MKKQLLTLLSILVLTAHSQKLDKSSSFPVPEGDSHVLQLKNGNAFLMEITKRDGIKVMLFDTLHKKISSSKLSLKILQDKIGYYMFEGLHDIGGDPTFFVQVAEERTPILIRVIVDGKTGKLKSEEKVASLERVKAGGGYAMLFGSVDIPDIEVVKDPDSDYYAIVKYNSMAEETKDRIEILHCSPAHKVINKINYTAPNDHFKYTRYLNAYVNQDNYVVMATYAFNTEKSGGDEGRFYLSQLSKGKSSLKQQELSYKDFYKKVECHFEYNKVKQTLHMAIMTNVESKGDKRYLEYHFQNINPSTLKVDPPYSPDFSQVNNYYTDKMERKDDFGGVLSKTAVDKNGNIILFFQQRTISTSSQGTVRIYNGDVALLTMSPSGKTINSAVFPASLMGEGGGFAMSMIPADNNNYIFFNNSVDNMDRPENKEPKTVKALGVCVPVKYTYGNNEVKKEYLFKQPKEKKGNPYCDFSVCDYNKNFKKYTTLYIDPEKDKASLVWVGVN